MGRLDGKVALITGGGGSIGAATARLFAQEGAKVVLADVDEDGLATVTDAIGAEHAAYVVTDVTDSDQVHEAVRIAIERFGGLDVAFANAGIFGDATPIVDYPRTSSIACWRSTSRARSWWPSTRSRSCARAGA